MAKRLTLGLAQVERVFQLLNLIDHTDPKYRAHFTREIRDILTRKEAVWKKRKTTSGVGTAIRLPASSLEVQSGPIVKRLAGRLNRMLSSP
jgi:hypothetical protein